MRKEKFYFNKHTLQYEKVVTPLKTKILRAFGISCGIFVAALVLLSVSYHFFPTPKEEALIREMEQMKRHYADMELEVEKMTKVLANLQERDASVHRMVFGMEPIDDSQWEAGIGGTDKYATLTKFKNSGETLQKTQEKVDKLSRQMVLQSESLDEIEFMAKSKSEMFASMPLIAPVRKDLLARNIHLLSGFGRRLHPIYKVMKMHQGIDFTAKEGTAIQASGNGKVIKVMKSPSYGNYVVIRHGHGYETLYAHMQEVMVKKGQKVKRGEQIGTVGNTGRSTAPHLHYEIHLNGKAINPLSYCVDGLSINEYEALVKSASKMNQSLD
ncbi:MAG: M23 family metallopeptidase [Bacteroidota bacterium]